MTYYAKQIDENGEVIALHTMDKPFTASSIFIPTTESEYATLLAGWESAQEEPTNIRTPKQYPAGWEEVTA